MTRTPLDQLVEELRRTYLHKEPTPLGPGSRPALTNIDHRLPRHPTDVVISKKHGSAFFGTDLATRLKGMQIDTLLIAGCVASGCLRASAVDASQYGFRPLVVREAVGDRSPLAHEANLLDIAARYGDVISLDEARRMISRQERQERQEEKI